MEGAPWLDAPREHVLTEDDFDIVLRMPTRTLSGRRYKITRYEDADGVGELYDLQEDPGEFVSRWDDPDYASIKSDLLATLDDVMNHDTKQLPSVGLVG
jgi:hypothetical protein